MSISHKKKKNPGMVADISNPIRAWGRYRWVLGITGHRDLLCTPHQIVKFLLLSMEVRRQLCGVWVLSSYLYLGGFRD